MDTSIRFNVEGENEVEGAYNRLQQSAESVARDMIRSARDYSSSGKEVLKDIEEQIRAIEKRNSLDQKFAKSDIRARVASGEITSEAGRAQISDITQRSSEDDKQVIILKEIVEEIRRSSREQIRQDRLGVESSLKNDERLSALGISDDEDEFEALRRTLQRQDLGLAKGEEEDEQSRFAGTKRAVRMGAGVGASFAGQNPFVAIAGLMTMIPLVGQALSGLAQQAFSAAENYQSAMGLNVGISGGTQGNFKGFGRSSEGLGYSMTQSLRLRESAMRAGGRGVSAGGVRDLQLLMRGGGLNEGTLMGMEGLQRGEVGEGSTRQNVQTIIRALQGTGAIEGGNLSLLPEYLQELVTLGKRQIQITGEVNTGVNIKTVAALTNLDDTFKNPTVLSGIMASLQSGLSSTPNAIAGGLQFSALSRMMPGGSMWELEKAKENPLENIEYLQNYMKVLQQASGGSDEMFFRNIHQAGLASSKTMAEKMGRGYLGGGLDEVLASGGGIDLESRSASATGELGRLNVKVQNRLADTGDTLAVKMNQLIKKIEEWVTESKTQSGSLKEAREDNIAIAEEMNKAGMNMKTAAKIMSTALKQQSFGSHAANYQIP